VLAGLGVVFSVFMQVKSDNDEEERIEEQKENRQKVRAEFNKAASELEAFGKEFIAECLELSLDKSISEINHNILEIQNTKTGKSNACKEMHDLLVQCQSLIYKIHAEA